MEALKGRVAVVTGGASGIGRGLCEAFARAGMRVVVADVDADGAERAAAELRECGAEALPVATDVSDRASVEALAETTFRELGGAHVVCNNAGVIVGGPLHKATDDDWRWLLSVNLGGVIHGCRAFVPRMLETGGPGHVVNTSSVGGFFPAPGLGVYCTTKFAVLGFTEALRSELAPRDIGVSALCPGGVRTRLAEADRNRPAHLGRAGGRVDSIREGLESGMDPIEVGECVVRGIRANAAYIFTHPEFREALESQFQAVLSAFPS
jgi:NAD(P)-dependent dehydrogenase (short-subunit alcohol dehydrogenase family)